MENIMLDRAARLQFYQCIRNDFSHVVTQFVKSECWGYVTFGNLASTFGITMSYHLATTQKGTRTQRADHRKNSIRLILMTCKDFWLLETKKENEEDIMVKRRIGGLFLTYIMYFAQPRHPGYRLRIQIDQRDAHELNLFELKMKSLHERLDGETEGNGFFESLWVLAKRLRREACELALVPLEYQLFDEIPALRAVQTEEYTADPLEMTLEYYKHHDFIRALEEHGRYDAMMPEARLKLSGTVFGKPFMDIVEDILEKDATHDWLKPENRIELTQRITKLFGTPHNEATIVSQVFLHSIRQKRFLALWQKPRGAVVTTLEQKNLKWEPCLLDKAFFKEDGSFELDRIFDHFGLTAEDFGKNELNVLEDVRAPPSQLVVQVPTGPITTHNQYRSDLEAVRGRIQHDHSYCRMEM